MFKFIRLTNAGERRERMTLEDKTGASYQLLFVDGEISTIKKSSERAFPDPFVEGKNVTRTKVRIIRGNAALFDFAKKQYAEIKCTQTTAVPTETVR